MINYLQVENLTKSYGDLVLFDNISFTIGEGQRIALIGRNGSGKTTLLNILAGKDTADSGTITPRRDLRIAYLEQNPEYAADLTVLEACFRSDNPALRAIAAYEQAVADPAQDGLQEAMSRMDALAAWDYEQLAKEILSRLKINDFDKKIGQLSGGQLKRVALAAVLISEADLLILDYPSIACVRASIPVEAASPCGIEDIISGSTTAITGISCVSTQTNLRFFSTSVIT